MAGLTAKDKEALAYLYELPEFRSFRKWCGTKVATAANMILKVDMGQSGASERVSMLQGQSSALQAMLIELQKIHKKEMAKAEGEVPQAKR